MLCESGSIFETTVCFFMVSASALGYVGKWLIIAVIVVAIGCSLGGEFDDTVLYNERK